MTVCHDNSQALFLSPKHTKEGKRQVGSVLARHHSMSYWAITRSSSKLFLNNAPTQNKNVCSFQIYSKVICSHTRIYSFSNYFPILKSSCGLKCLLEISFQVPRGLVYENREKQRRPALVKSEFKESLKCSHAKSVEEKFRGSGRKKKMGEYRLPGNSQKDGVFFFLVCGLTLYRSEPHVCRSVKYLL